MKPERFPPFLAIDTRCRRPRHRPCLGVTPGGRAPGWGYADLKRDQKAVRKKGARATGGAARILELMSRRDRAWRICHLVRETGLPDTTIQYQIGQLRRSGLVFQRVYGPRITRYLITDDGRVRAWRNRKASTPDATNKILGGK